MIRMSNLQANGWDLTNLKHIELDEADLKRYSLHKASCSSIARTRRD